MNEWSETYIIHSKTSLPITKAKKQEWPVHQASAAPGLHFRTPCPLQRCLHLPFYSCALWFTLWWFGREKWCDLLRGSIIRTQALLPDSLVWILTLPFIVRPWARQFPCASLSSPVKRINGSSCLEGSLWRRAENLGKFFNLDFPWFPHV